LGLTRRWLHELGVAATSGIDFDLARGHEYVRFSYAGATERHGRGMRTARRVDPVTDLSFRTRPQRTGRGHRRVDAVTAALAGLRVIDMSTVLAGPNCARYLADFGADVIKVERPGGDSLRNMAWRDPRDGEGLWWKLVNRNKRTIVLDVKDPADLDVLLSLVDDAHVLIENSRPGTMERLGLGPEVLLERNPTLVMTRVSGFGQDGPYASRPGFATIAEAMSGLAALSGEPDGQPLLPPIALTDEVTGLAAAFATMVALHSGVGQVVDANLLETMFQMMGPLASLYAVTRRTTAAAGRRAAVHGAARDVSMRRRPLGGGVDEQRLGGRAGDGRAGRRRRRTVHHVRRAHRAPRRTRAGDDRLVPRSDTVRGDRRRSPRRKRRSGPSTTWPTSPSIRTTQARGAIADVGGTPMQGLIARLSATPGELRWSGRELDADGEQIRRSGWT
jgi:crotonobetainyl-CoA:carnitine CoA-transferase CaiB-like acyl-CoA transferase